jgi:non-ribosomal peptide synthase protein (TIGR01720 family)
VPQRGIGYGILRFLGDPAVARELKALPSPQVSFNYLGQFDTSFSGSSLFRLLHESSDGDRSPLNPRPHLVEIDGHVAEGTLRFAWTYSAEVHRAATIERVAHDYLERLRALAAACGASGEMRLATSDFPLAQLSQRDLDALGGMLSGLGDQPKAQGA